MANLAPPSSDVSRSLSLVGWLMASWVVLLIVGFTSLCLPGALAARNPVSFNRAVFTSANVATQTGFAQQFAQPTNFAHAVQWIFALQTLSGALLSLIGGGVLLARALRLPYTDSQIAATALLILASGAVVGTLTWHSGESLMRAAFRGLGAVSCSGFVFGNTTDAKSPAFAALLGPVSVIGSLGVIVLLDIFDALRARRPLHDHVRRVIVLAAVVYFIGTAIAAIFFVLDGAPLRSALLRASGIALSARGYGLPFEFASDWPRAVAWLGLVITVVGAGTAGACGTLGLGWLATTSTKVWRILHRVLLLQAGVLMLVLLVMLQTEPQLSAERIVLLVVGAGMNVGLSHEPISITGIGLIFLATAMVFGKILPLIFLRQVIYCEHNYYDDRRAAQLDVVDNPL